MTILSRTAATTAAAAAAIFLGGVLCPMMAASAPLPQASSVRKKPSVKALPALRFQNRTASDVATQLSKVSGTPVVVDRLLANVPITLATTGGTLDSVLAKMTALLPKGVKTYRVMLPALAPNAPLPDGEVVASLARAQEEMVYPVMGAKVERTTDSVNVLGRILPADKAEAVIAALDLKPVYLLAMPAKEMDGVQKMAAMQAEGLKLWLSLSPEQQTEAVGQQFDMLMNMDPDTRRAMFGQMQQQGAVMRQKLQALPDAQRRQFFLDVTGGKSDGTNIPQGGGAAGGGAAPGGNP